MNEPRIAVISQPRYLPACNYIHRMLVADVFICLDTVQFTPRDFENRNRIKTQHGGMFLTVPVKRRFREEPIREIRIDNEQNWRRKHWVALRTNYAKAPYFSHHTDFFTSLYQKTWNYLIDLNEEIIHYVTKLFALPCQFVRASELLSTKEKGQGLLISLCEKVDANIYLSGPLGQNYIDKERFQKADLSLVYHHYQHPEYEQLWGNFLPYMGIVDLLFNCGPKSRQVLAEGNVTKAELKTLRSVELPK